MYLVELLSVISNLIKPDDMLNMSIETKAIHSWWNSFEFVNSSILKGIDRRLIQTVLWFLYLLQIGGNSSQIAGIIQAMC